jgi:hypothetical protein
MQSRRVFLGSTAALGVVGAATVFRAHAQGQGHAAAHAQEHGAPADPVLGELRQQMITAVRGLKAGGGGEPARRIAGVLRVAQAAGIARQFDTRLRAAVRRHGRDAILQQAPDLDRFAAEMRVFGITDPFALAPASYAERARVLDGVLARGLAPLLLATCDRLEALAPALDRRMVLPVQMSPDNPCWQPCSEVFALEIMVIFACLGSMIDFGISCFFLSGMLVGLKLGYAMQGCLC